MRRVLSGTIYLLSGLLGLMAFLYPFFMPITAKVAHGAGLAHSEDAPLVTGALVGLCVVALIVELQGQAISAKTVALLGVLVAITSILRFLEVAIPLPGGFSPVFAPIILTGYVFGSRFGFLMGAFSLLVSGLVTGGVGPWLPYQMFTAGWAGLTAGWVGSLLRRGPLPRETFQVLILSAFGFLWGLVYGVISNMWFWPFATGPAEQTWSPGIGLAQTLTHYATFYVVTSLGWDMARGVGNVLLIVFLGAPVIRALTRFRRRFQFLVKSTDA